jgi:hypothetical protein
MFTFANPRVVIAEVFEWQGRYKEAIRCVHFHADSHTIIRSYNHFLLFNRSFAAAEIQDCFNFSASSKVRAGRVLGRCHAALGEHALSVSASDAAIDLAKRGRFLLSEALSIRGRVLAGQESHGGGSGSGLHWDEREGKQRLTDMIGRMQGPAEPLEQLLPHAGL